MAAIDLRVKSELYKLRDLSQKLSSREVSRATSAAINRSLSRSFTVIKSSIRQKYNISAYDLRDYRILKSTPQSLEGNLKVKRDPISLARFNPRFISVSNSGNTAISVRKSKDGLTKSSKLSKRKSPAKGVSIEIKKGKRMNIPYAFMIKNDSMKPVFARGEYMRGNGGYSFVKRRKRVTRKGSDLPISKLLSTSVYGSTTNPAIQSKVSVDVSAWYQKRLIQELTYRINRIQA